jgi:hypothetical protein
MSAQGRVPVEPSNWKTGGPHRWRKKVFTRGSTGSVVVIDATGASPAVEEQAARAARLQCKQGRSVRAADRHPVRLFACSPVIP